jgi:hypothetical protein
MTQHEDPHTDAGQKVAGQLTMAAGIARILVEILRRRKAKERQPPKPGPDNNITPPKRDEITRRWALEGRPEDRELMMRQNPELVEAYDDAARHQPHRGIAMSDAAHALEMADQWEWDEVEDGTWIGRQTHDGIDTFTALTPDDDGVYTLTDLDTGDYQSVAPEGHTYRAATDGTVTVTPKRTNDDTTSREPMSEEEAIRESEHKTFPAHPRPEDRGTYNSGTDPNTTAAAAARGPAASQ